MSIQNIPFSISKRKSPLIFPNLQPCNFFQGTQELVRNSRVNEPSGFEPLKFYCINNRQNNKQHINQPKRTKTKVPLGIDSNGITGGLDQFCGRLILALGSALVHQHT